ncbi:MAG TPA: NUDIX domain-containing protein [Puia sp.]|nr:NUDIX domain-containing protein [Puia sp.]
MKQLFTAGLVVIENRKLLLAYSKNKRAWYLPGGKTADGESADETLIREIEEELGIRISRKDLKYYTHITAPAFGENPDVIMEQECYLHNLMHRPLPSSEIEAVNFFDSRSYLEQAQVPGVVLLMRKLLEDGLID